MLYRKIEKKQNKSQLYHAQNQYLCCLCNFHWSQTRDIYVISTGLKLEITRLENYL